MKKRPPAVAGMFYSIEPAILDKHIKEFMLSAKTKPSCIGVISPHAGYAYSGRTAAFAISSLKPAKSFIVLGPNHTGLGAEFSVMSSGIWSTPLGNTGIDEKLASKLLSESDFLAEDARAHAAEHSIEVQLPFLQERFNDFRFVPICIMNTGYSDEFMEKCIVIGESVAEIARSLGGIGIVASSDFSHYVPPETIEKREKHVVNAILELDVPKFFDALAGSDASVCGYGPIAVLMSAAKELGLRARDIHNSNSGGGSAVSYRAIGFE